MLSIAPINEGTEGAVGVADDDSGAGGGTISLEEAQALCVKMDQAKKDKDYEASDAIRAQILEAGYEVQQGKDGTSIKGRLA